MMPMGGDFCFQNATTWFTNMDRLIKLVNDRVSQPTASGIRCLWEAFCSPWIRIRVMIVRALAVAGILCPKIICLQACFSILRLQADSSILCVGRFSILCLQAGFGALCFGRFSIYSVCGQVSMYFVQAGSAYCLQADFSSL